MFDYLVDHALKNVWCTPNQDMQHIFEPAKISPAGGIRKKIRVLWEDVALPNQTDVFYVYQIGQYHPSLLNVLPERRVWRTVSRLCRMENLMMDLYTSNGVQYPRCQSWILVTQDQNIIIAVKKQDRIQPSLFNEPLYVRFYSNAFFASARKNQDGYPNLLYIYGKTLLTNSDIADVQSRFNTYKAKPGATSGWVNGYWTNRLYVGNMQLGDIVEFVYDSTVYKTVDIGLNELQTFESVLDLKRKYLLHAPSLVTDTIEYRDDIDFWCYKSVGTDLLKGVYYHKNAEDSVRMITHKDYSLPVMYLQAYVDNAGLFSNLDQIRLRLNIRKSGYHRPLVNEHNRIKELYKLAPADIPRAMLGLESGVPQWRAEELEKSDYTRIMRKPEQFVTRTMVQDAYGYNAIAKLVGDSPLEAEISNGSLVVHLPYGLRLNSTVFEYDSEGILLDFHQHYSGEYYTVRNTACAFVEGFAALGSLDQGAIFGQPTTQLIPGVDYRFYICGMGLGGPDENWVDVTGSDEYTINSSGLLTWNVSSAIYYTQVKPNNRFLAYHYNMDPWDGVLRFSVNAQETHEGSTAVRVLSLPVGILEIWLNGYTLVENIDYIVRWPEIVIINKEYRRGGSQRITVRGSGYCTPDLKRETDFDSGFVSYGVLSRNGRFDIRDDKVMRVAVRGKVYLRDELEFSEDTGELVGLDELNGSPYAMIDQIVPLRGLVDDTTYNMRAESKVIDEVISDYLTLKKPEPVPQLPSMIPERFMLYSPFCCKVLHDLRTGVIDQEPLEGNYGDYDIRQMLADYEYLLPYDPTQDDTLVDPNFAHVHPHERTVTIQLNIYQWTFLKRVIGVYLNNRVDLSRFTTVEVL